MPSEIKLTEPGMLPELYTMWQNCFPAEDVSAIDMFLRERFRPEDCLVSVVGKRVAAMVHMLPVQVAGEQGLLQAHYIYAAATSPDFRSRGLMGELLTKAVQYGLQRGDVYSLLLPSTQSLYDYYSRHDYLPVYKTRFVTLTRDEMLALAGDDPLTPGDDMPARMESIRHTVLNQSPGSVLWDSRAITYAGKVAQIYDGKLVSGLAYGATGYAIGTPEGEGRVEINELFAEPKALSALVGSVLRELPGSSYRIRLPVMSPFFPGQGESETFGMLKPLTTEAALQLKKFNEPYMGLTLD